VNKLTTGLLIDEKQAHKHRVLTEKINDIRAIPEHIPTKSLKRLAKQTGMFKSSVRRATQFLALRPYKTTVIHDIQPRVPASRIHFCSLFLQSVVEGEIDPQLIFFSNETWFHLQGYILTYSWS
jgi:hypothetical protein